MVSAAPGPPPINLAYMSMRHASMPERVTAAAAAGFDGVGLRPEAVPGLRAGGWSNERIRELVQTRGICISEIEPLRIFRDDLLELCLDLVPFFDAPRVQVAPQFEPTIDMPAAARWLADAARRLAPAELSIEFIPTTGLPDVATTVSLIDRTNQPNVALCVDAWHVFRGAGLSSLACLDPHQVGIVQLGDGTMAPALDDYIQDCLSFRRPVGDGEFDLAAFMSMVPRYAAVSVEVISIELDALPAADVAQRLFDTTSALLSSS